MSVKEIMGGSKEKKDHSIDVSKFISDSGLIIEDFSYSDLKNLIENSSRVLVNLNSCEIRMLSGSGKYEYALILWHSIDNESRTASLICRNRETNSQEFQGSIDQPTHISVGLEKKRDGTFLPKMTVSRENPGYLSDIIEIFPQGSFFDTKDVTYKPDLR